MQGMRVDSSDPDLLAEIPLGGRNVLRVTRKIERGHEIVNLRVWFTSRDGEARPGKDGVAIPAGTADSLMKALARSKSCKQQPATPALAMVNSDQPKRVPPKLRQVATND